MRFLSKGDCVGVLCPSSPLREGTLEGALASIRSMGLEFRIYPSVKYSGGGFLAGTDEERAEEVTDAFADPYTAGIVCLRGGYGAMRILGLVDWNAAVKNPKPLYGYSDVTALHMKLASLGIPSFHSPMPGSEWRKGLDEYTQKSLEACLFGPLPEAIDNPPGAELEAFGEGSAEGPLIGGNLTLVASSLGTPYEIDTKGKVIFLEDLDERPYQIDRLFTQLEQAGKFKDAAGVILGSLEHCVDPDPDYQGPDALTVARGHLEKIAKAGTPALSGLVCGHAQASCSLPLLATVAFDSDAKAIRVKGYENRSA